MWNEAERVSPDDRLSYVIPLEAIRHTEIVLREYGKLRPSNEGLVYWAGHRKEAIITISMVIAPKTDSAPRRVSTSPESNVEMIQVLAKHDLIHLAQVHSHPGNWVDHSDGDDEWAAFKVNGLLSVVVPAYGEHGMIPLTKCGIHRFISNQFRRLSDSYVETHFNIATELVCNFKDLRK